MGIWVPWLAEAARMTGYPVIEIPNWRYRGHGPMRAVEGVVGHHTANPQRGDYPSLRIVRDGRSDLAGPLAQFGLARSGTIYVIAAGLSWHAGASAWAGFTDLGDEFLGIEAESAGTRDDWTVEQRDCYPRLIAALLYYMRRGADRFGFHKEVCRPRGRKIDAAYWDGPQTRDRIGWLLGDPLRRIPRFATPGRPIEQDEQEDDMAAVPQGEWTEIRDKVRALWHQMQGPGERGWETWTGDKKHLSMVDLARATHVKANVVLGLKGRPGGDDDDLLGHVLSTRAELRQAAKKWDDYINRAGA